MGKRAQHSVAESCCAFFWLFTILFAVHCRTLAGAQTPKGIFFASRRTLKSFAGQFRAGGIHGSSITEPRQHRAPPWLLPSPAHRRHALLSFIAHHHLIACASSSSPLIMLLSLFIACSYASASSSSSRIAAPYRRHRLYRSSPSRHRSCRHIACCHRLLIAASLLSPHLLSSLLSSFGSSSSSSSISSLRLLPALLLFLLLLWERGGSSSIFKQQQRHRLPVALIFFFQQRIATQHQRISRSTRAYLRASYQRRSSSYSAYSAGTKPPSAKIIASAMCRRHPQHAPLPAAAAATFFLLPLPPFICRAPTMARTAVNFGRPDGTSVTRISDFFSGQRQFFCRLAHRIQWRTVFPRRAPPTASLIFSSINTTASIPPKSPRLKALPAVSRPRA